MPSFIAGKDETVEAKKRILDECGIAVSETPSEVGSTLVDRLKSMLSLTLHEENVTCNLLINRNKVTDNLDLGEGPSKFGCLIPKSSRPSRRTLAVISPDSRYLSLLIRAVPGRLARCLLRIAILI